MGETAKSKRVSQITTPTKQKQETQILNLELNTNTKDQVFGYQTGLKWTEHLKPRKKKRTY